MNIRNASRCALCAALMALCGWISIPAGAIAFTLQSFALFAALFLLGGRLGSLSVLVYLLLGAAGLPVFSGFQGGIAAFFGPTGGFLAGFLAAGLVYWAVTALFPAKKLLAAIAGQLACYLLGCLWYQLGFLRQAGTEGFLAALGACVLPFLLPDALKLAAAWLAQRRVRITPS